MKPTRPINATGNPYFRYVPRVKTDVAATVKRWRDGYNQAWDDAHAEKAERESKQANVQPIKRKEK